VTEAERIKITDSLIQFGGTLTMAQAATKFGVPRGSVCRWAKERNDGKVVPIRVVETPPAAPDSSPRARDTARGRELRAGEMVTAIGEDACEDIREIVPSLTRVIRDRVRELRNGPPADTDLDTYQPPDPVHLAALTRSLDTLLTRAVDVLAFRRAHAPLADTPPDLATPDGEAAVAAQLASLPRHLLERALRRA